MTEDAQDSMLDGATFAFEDQPCSDRERSLTERLVAFNRDLSPQWTRNHDDRFHASDLQIFALGPGGAVVAGVTGRTHVLREWLEIRLLWVDDPFRKRGLGRELVRRAESEAVRRGCRFARLSTSGHQSPGFYLRLGYVIYGKLEDCPPGETVYYFRKDLKTEP